MLKPPFSVILMRITASFWVVAPNVVSQNTKHCYKLLGIMLHCMQQQSCFDIIGDNIVALDELL
jgi:hypothetical protein